MRGSMAYSAFPLYVHSRVRERPPRHVDAGARSLPVPPPEFDSLEKKIVMYCKNSPITGGWFFSRLSPSPLLHDPPPGERRVLPAILVLLLSVGGEHQRAAGVGEGAAFRRRKEKEGWKIVPHFLSKG